MEKVKMSKAEREARLVTLREERVAKQNARIEKMRQMNLQKYNHEDTKSTQHLKPSQTRPRNFNSMTDLRRKSFAPKTDSKPTKASTKSASDAAKLKKSNSSGHNNLNVSPDKGFVILEGQAPHNSETGLGIDGSVTNECGSNGSGPDDIGPIESAQNVPLDANDVNKSDEVPKGNGRVPNVKKSSPKPKKSYVNHIKVNRSAVNNSAPKTHSSIPKINEPAQKTKSLPKISTTSNGFKSAHLAKGTVSSGNSTGTDVLKKNNFVLTKQFGFKPNLRHSMFVTSDRTTLKAGPSKTDQIKKYEPPKTLKINCESRITMKKTIAPLKTFSAKKYVPLKSDIPTLIPSGKFQSYSARKSMPAKESHTPGKLSVFERLYRPKNVADKQGSIRKENIFEQKLRLATKLAKTRLSMFPSIAPKDNMPVMRRSISAVHLKKIGKDQLKNCIHKCSSIGENLDTMDLEKINEDEAVVQDQIVSAVRSERKKSVKFHRATSFMNVNTPRADDLQRKLKAWLKKRGKSLDSYHHLQCFGVHRLAPSQKAMFDFKNDENKENIEVHIPDDASYTDNMNDREHDFEEGKDKWREASCDDLNDSADLSDSHTTCTGDTTVISEPTLDAPVDDVVLGALTDLSQLVREGFEWEQCARWLRAIRERCPQAPDVAAYWECRAALEERQGNFPRSCQCWEEAIAKGTETSVVEASLDQLLDKFMQLNINPSGRGEGRHIDPKMLDVKNVFKSTLIRFAVQQAKIKKAETPKYTVTPVRRSSRLSVCPGPVTQTPEPPKGTPYRPSTGTKRTPLVQLCSSLRQIDEDIRDKSVFVPNKLLHFSP